MLLVVLIGLKEINSHFTGICAMYIVVVAIFFFFFSTVQGVHANLRAPFN